MIEAPPLIAVLVHDLSATGVVRNAIRIAGAVAAGGAEVELWVIRKDGKFAADVPEGVRIVEIGVPFGLGKPVAGRGLQNLLAAPRLARLINSRKPRLLLSAGNHFHFAAGVAYRLAGRPAHTRFVGRASNATPRAGRTSSLAGRIANLADSLKYREMDHIIAVSHELAGDLAGRLGIAAGRVTVIANGIDAAEARRRAAAPLDDPWFEAGAPPVVISAGRLSKQKNYGLLIEAFARLRQERPARLVILGEGPPAIRQALSGQIARLKLEADVRLPGFEANPFRYFARSGVFVLSSLWEGASNAILEALACGCPVVSVDCPTGVREQLDNGRIGPIVPQGDAAALAAAIGRRLAAPRDADALRAYAEGFDLNLMLAAYRRLLGDLAASGRTGR